MTMTILQLCTMHRQTWPPCADCPPHWPPDPLTPGTCPLSPGGLPAWPGSTLLACTCKCTGRLPRPLKCSLSCVCVHTCAPCPPRPLSSSLPHAHHICMQVRSLVSSSLSSLRDFEFRVPEGGTPICVVGQSQTLVGRPGTREEVAATLTLACRCVSAGGGRWQPP